jgi:hypothetical protein
MQTFEAGEDSTFKIVRHFHSPQWTLEKKGMMMPVPVPSTVENVKKCHDAGNIWGAPSQAGGLCIELEVGELGCGY